MPRAWDPRDPSGLIQTSPPFNRLGISGSTRSSREASVRPTWSHTLPSAVAALRGHSQWSVIPGDILHRTWSAPCGRGGHLLMHCHEVVLPKLSGISTVGEKSGGRGQRTTKPEKACKELLAAKSHLATSGVVLVSERHTHGGVRGDRAVASIPILE